MSLDLTFKKYTEEDFEDYYTLVSDDLQMRFITGVGMSVEQARAKFDQILQINAEHEPLGYFKIINSDNLQVIGECKLVNYKDEPTQFEVGYLVKKEFWKQGLGSRVCASMLQLADSLDSSKQIIGLIDPTNLGSKRILEKTGFTSVFCGEWDGVPTEKFCLFKGAKSF